MTYPARVFVVGVDAATLTLIELWVEEGMLPSFATLMERGTYGPLASVPNMNSAPAWSTFATGQNPGKHGIFYFTRQRREDYQIDVVNATYREGHAFWRILSDAGKRVGIVNVPISYPAEELNGFMISGLDTPYVGCEGFTYPPGLYKELLEQVGAVEIEPGMPSFVKAGKITEGIEKTHKTLEQRANAVEWLMATKPWDLFVVVFTAIDSVQHFFWKHMTSQADDPEILKYRDVIKQTYVKMDQVIGRLLSHLDDATIVFLVSDHGAGPSFAGTKLLPEWLIEKGFSTRREPGSSGKSRQLYTRAFKALYRLIDTSLTRNQKLMLAHLFPRLRRRAQSEALFSDIDWDRTLVYLAESRNEIRLNVKGREGSGIIDPGEEYERIRDSVMKALLDWREPDSGQPFVKQVFRREEVYSGKHLEDAPDILIHWDTPNVDIVRSGVDPLSYNYVTGDHQPFGTLAVCGNGVKKGAKIEEATLADIAPTILCLFDVPIPIDMDGRVLLGLFESAFAKELHPEYWDAASNSFTPIREYDSEESELVEERLRGLGYID
jgi:predicted AlkP superfamily phosphohydrolase/phosphomutase